MPGSAASGVIIARVTTPLELLIAPCPSHPLGACGPQLLTIGCAIDPGNVGALQCIRRYLAVIVLRSTGREVEFREVIDVKLGVTTPSRTTAFKGVQR
jgi:hypothetical protein